MEHGTTRFGRLALAAGVCVLAAGVGCAHVSREELGADLDALEAELRAERQAQDEALGQRIDGFESTLNALDRRQAGTEARLAQLAQDLEEMETEFGVTIERLENAIAFNVPVHFDYDSVTLGDRETQVLDRFAHVYGAYYGGGLVTVEGFTDPAGTEAYNLRLGQRRAEGVMGYLTEVAGIAPQQVRAVSYGESSDRMVAPGAWGPGSEGAKNRRVVLVIEGTADMLTSGPGGGPR